MLHLEQVEMSYIPIKLIDINGDIWSMGQWFSTFYNPEAGSVKSDFCKTTSKFYFLIDLQNNIVRKSMTG